jgi:hypothetical protein
VFWSVLDKKVIWRCPHTDQLNQASEWFGYNPFVENVQIHAPNNRVTVFDSPEINISVLSPGRVASREADCLIYDEMGWCFNHLALFDYYKFSRPMIAASKFKHILHASTPARNTAFFEEWENLKGLEEKYNTKFTSEHPWRDTSWITEEWIEQERLKNIDCPWYIEQNYECQWVIYGGAVFSDIIFLGDPRFPQFPMDFFERKFMHPRTGEMKTTHAGLDFNGDIVGHYLVEIRYDDNYVYVMNETVFRDLNFLSELPLWDWYNPLSLEIEDGMFNLPFADACRRLGIPAVYQEFDEYIKAERIAQLKKRTILIDRIKCPMTYRNLMSAAYDQSSRLPKLEKRTDQHGLDALIHAIHDTSDRIHYRDKRKKDIFGRFIQQAKLEV